MSLHRCPEADCTYFGKPSAESCGCHKTDAQVIRDQRCELLEALERLADTYDAMGNPRGPARIWADIAIDNARDAA